jgi:hypothetical protein
VVIHFRQFILDARIVGEFDTPLCQPVVLIMLFNVFIHQQVIDVTVEPLWRQVEM